MESEVAQVWTTKCWLYVWLTFENKNNLIAIQAFAGIDEDGHPFLSQRTRSGIQAFAGLPWIVVCCAL
jgi:hypothetical protein